MIEFPYKTALVTGGAGFIGSNICAELLRQRINVICIDNMVAGKSTNIQEFVVDKRFEFIEADVIDIDPSHFEGVDVVFHNAASKCTVCKDNPRLDLNVNAWGTLSVIEAAHKAGVKKVVHASTGSTMGGEPVSYYGVSKLAGEKYYKAYRSYNNSFKYSILRYFHVYGPKQDKSDFGGVIPVFIDRILNNKPITIFGDGEQVRHFTHVLDVVRANLFLAAKEDTDYQTYDIPSDTIYTINYLRLAILKLLSQSTDYETEWLQERDGDIKTFNVSSDKIKNLGFVFRKEFHGGLIETVNWYKKQHNASV